MQNLIYFMTPSQDAEDISWKAGNLLLNRFCIDEDAACELSGVYNLKEWSRDQREHPEFRKLWNSKCQYN